MFTPKRMPKEGRSLPGLPYAGSSPSPRGRFGRSTVLIVVLILCVPFLYYVTQSGNADTALLRGAGEIKPISLDHMPDNDKGAIRIPKVIKDDSAAPRRPQQVISVDKDEADDRHVEPSEKAPSKPATDKVVETDDEDDDDMIKRPKPGSHETTKKHKQGPNAEKWSDRPAFEKAMEKLLNLMPDDVIRRELTRNVEVTGKDRMREMGLRTRSYKKYFEAWEAVHLVENDEGSVYVRDDVIQYLRSHDHKGSSKHISDEGGLAGKSLADTIREYESYRSFLQKFANMLFPWTMPYFADHMALHAHIKKGGRGIVLTAGDDQAPYLLTTIHSYRELGCNLPIEVMYLGDSDLGEDYRMELEALDGVVTRDIAQMVNDEGWKLAGWAAKPFAILLSSFREVIFIDADSLFFRDPETLFDEPGYKNTGALFFKDRLIMPESKRRWLQQVLPTPIPKKAKESRFWTGDSGHQQESGVIVVDKWKHLIPLLLVTRLNGPDRDGNKETGKVGVYDMVYGDKETFWVGWLLSGSESYHFHEGDAGIMGLVKDPDDRTRRPKRVEDPDHPDDRTPEEKEKDEKEENKLPANPDRFTICAPQLLHLDTDGKPLWFNGWLLDNKFAERSKKKFASFRSYLVEPRELRDPGAWQLAESNMCCLTSDKDRRFDFNEKEMATLKMIMDRAREKKAFGNQ